MRGEADLTRGPRQASGKHKAPPHAAQAASPTGSTLQTSGLHAAPQEKALGVFMVLDPLLWESRKQYVLTLLVDLWENAKRRENPQGLTCLTKQAFIIP